MSTEQTKGATQRAYLCEITHKVSKQAPSPCESHAYLELADPQRTETGVFNIKKQKGNTFN